MKILNRTKQAILATTLISSLAMAEHRNNDEPVLHGDGPWPMLLSYDDKADVLAIKEQHDFWKIDEKNKTVLMLVKNFNEHEALTKAGFNLTVHQKLEKHFAQIEGRSWDENIKAITNFACYRTVEETYADMTDMESNHPNIVELVNIGPTWHKTQANSDFAGHDLQIVKITNKINGINNKPILYAMGSIHAREYPPAELVTRFADFLLAQYGTDADVTWLVDHHEIHLLLQGNPDGRIIAENELQYHQRKNYNENHCYQGSHQGVDMNRNFNFLWNQGTGSSGQQCGESFRGLTALSEPETLAIDNYIKQLFSDDRPNDITTPAPDNKMGVYLDIHNVAGLTLFPWGYSDFANPAPNHDQLMTLARRMSYFTGYRPEQSNDSLGGADGASDDNAYGTLGVAAYTIELDDHGDGFFYTGCDTFNETIWPDNLPALIYAAKASRQPYIDSSGPTIENLPTIPVEGASGQNLTVQGLATDLNFYQNNGTESTQNITAVQAYIGTPPWENGATAVAMAAQDGSFNSKSENFTGQIPLTGVPSGKQLVWITATDASGTTGVPSAFFVDVVNSGDLGTLSGTVTELGSNDPIELAQVAYDGIQTSTNANGFYEIQATFRTADLMVSKAGYEAMTFNGVSVVAQQTTTQNVQLMPKCGDISNDLNAYSSFNDAAAEGWTAAAAQGTNDWRIEGNDGVSNSPAFVATDVGVTTDKYLISPEVALDQNATLSFMHKHDFESNNVDYDGGVLEISIDYGENWSDLGNHMTQNGYNGTLSSGGSNPLAGRAAFVDNLGSFQEVVVDLSGFNGQTVQFRWRLGEDVNTGAGDWVIDDIELQGYQSCVVDTDLIFEDGFEAP
ncbi:M14 family zinc carboxypeptidase [Marinicella rhabdoformis]|uniref:M14 family zinc carboxypeptidase n=1 Tax=Marinicella rhabdoformis TaxID=2580566 RepID=UPI0012AEC440|nr:M14 family zinc carboxypeptidase [Marinicella rhabdoformis]